MSAFRPLFLGFGAALLLVACDELPTNAGDAGVITSEMRRDFLDAVATTGCVLRDDRQYGAVEFQAGLTREQTVAIASSYLARNRAERLGDGNTIRIMTGPCAA